MRAAVLIVVCLTALASSVAAEILRLDREGFTIWLDCDRRGAVQFRYVRRVGDMTECVRMTSGSKENNPVHTDLIPA